FRTIIHPDLFFFRDAAPTEIYTLSLHDALPISMNWSPRLPAKSRRASRRSARSSRATGRWCGSTAGRSRSATPAGDTCKPGNRRSEEHTSELQSRSDLVCRLLLEKKKKKNKKQI